MVLGGGLIGSSRILWGAKWSGGTKGLYGIGGSYEVQGVLWSFCRAEGP